MDIVAISPPENQDELVKTLQEKILLYEEKTKKSKIFKNPSEIEKIKNLENSFYETNLSLENITKDSKVIYNNISKYRMAIRNNFSKNAKLSENYSEKIIEEKISQEKKIEKKIFGEKKILKKNIKKLDSIVDILMRKKSLKFKLKILKMK